MAATLKLEVVTPEAKIFSEDVEMVTLTGTDGEMGILPQHMPLMTGLASGEILARKDGQNIFLAVGAGFVQVTGEKVSMPSPRRLREPLMSNVRRRNPRTAAQDVARTHQSRGRYGAVDSH